MNPSEFNLNLAVVIGINDYHNGISPLGTAKQDAEAIAAILEQDYHYQVKLLTDKQATGKSLKSYLETEITNILKESNPSRLVFYFAGHGIALNGDDGPQGYLIPQDAKLGDVTTYLPMQQVEAALSALPCQHCLVVLDCCFAGAFRWSSTRKLSVVEEIIHKERFDRFIKDPAWQVITSAASDQFALDNLDLNSDRRIAKENSHHSPFAAALMEALRGKADAYPPAKNGKPAGDGIITATELYLYLRDAVEVPTDARNQRQTPQIWCLKKHDKGEFIFLPPGHELNLPPAPTLDNLEENNPYRGLKSYETKDSDLFFGRTSLIEKLCHTVSDRPLTVVLGASGSGKSSLVKAGLIPSLPLNQVYQWHSLSPIRPGESPLNSLNSVLKELGNVTTEQVNSQIFIKAITVWNKANPQTKLLLVVDQLEELITLCRNDEEKQQFLDILATLINTFPDVMRLVVTLRSDFEPQLRNTPLEPLWQAGRFVVPAMTREELRSVIEEPASAKVVYFESLDEPDKGYLVDRLIDEVAGMPGALPLLSFALSELYLKLVRRYLEAQNAGDTVERAITWADYDALGGVTKSLTQRADEIYEELVKVDPAYEKTIRNVMLRMVAVGGELARRQVPELELRYPEPENGRVQQVLSRFSAVRLLVSGTDADDQPYIEPAHDALVRGWEKLQEWVKENMETLTLQPRLTPQANDWCKNNKNTEYLWIRDPRLALLEKVLESQTNNWLNQLEVKFVETSKQRRIDELEETKKQLRISEERRARAEVLQKADRVQNLLAVQPLEGLVLAIAAMGQNLNELPEDILGSTHSSLLAALKEAKECNQFMIAEQDFIETAAFSPNGKYMATGNGFTPVGTPGMKPVDGTIWLRDIQGKPISKAMHHRGRVEYIAFSSNSKYIASRDSDEEVVKIWDLQGNLIKKEASSSFFNITNSDSPIIAYSETNESLSFAPIIHIKNKKISFCPGNSAFGDVKSLSPDKSYIAIVKGLSNVITVQTKTIQEDDNHQQKITILRAGEGSIKAMNFSQDNRYLTGVCSDKTLRVWEVQDDFVISIQHNKYDEDEYAGSYLTFSFNANSQSIITSGRGGTIKIWDLEGKERYTFTISEDYIHSIAVSPNGKHLIGGGSNLHLWDIKGNQIDKPFEGHEHTIESVVFSPDNKYIISGSFDTTIRLWDLKRQNIKTIELAKEPFHVNKEVWSVKLVAFSSDSKYIVAGISTEEYDFAGIVQLVDIEGKPLGQPFGNDWRFALSPNGKYVAIADLNNTIQLWEIKGNRVGSLFRGHENQITSLAFSPDGFFIASGSYDNTVKIWDTKGNLINTFIGHTKAIKFVSFSPDGQYIASAGFDGTVRLWPGNWKTMLKVACNRLKHHPALKNSQTEAEKQACEACQRYVWDKEDTSV